MVDNSAAFRGGNAIRTLLGKHGRNTGELEARYNPSSMTIRTGVGGHRRRPGYSAGYGTILPRRSIAESWQWTSEVQTQMLIAISRRLGGLNVRRQHGDAGDRKETKGRRKQTHPRI